MSGCVGEWVSFGEMFEGLAHVGQLVICPIPERCS